MDFLKGVRRKNFQIEDGNLSHQSGSDDLSAIGNDRFHILGEHRVQKPDDSMITDPGGFSVLARSRPKQCPYCKTTGNITKLSSKKWQCGECKYTWK